MSRCGRIYRRTLLRGSWFRRNYSGETITLDLAIASMLKFMFLHAHFSSSFYFDFDVWCPQPRTTLITLSKSLDPPEVKERLRPLRIRIVEKENELDIQPPQEPVDLIFFSTGMEFGKFAHVIHEGTYVAVPIRGDALVKLDGFKTLGSFVGLDKRYFLLQKVIQKVKAPSQLYWVSVYF